MRTCYLRIAGLMVGIGFKNVTNPRFTQPPMQYLPFACKVPEKEQDVFMSFVLDDEIEITPDDRREPIGNFYTGVEQMKHGVFRRACGGYYFCFYGSRGEVLYNLLCSHDFKKCILAFGRPQACSPEYAFNNALMIAYAFAAAGAGCLLMHSSTVVLDGKAYCFLGRSGTGKSTHSSLWLKNFEGTRLLNDDNPVIRIEDGKAMVYGSPWSGKTPCYRQESAPIAAVVMLKQAASNKMEPLDSTKALASMLASCTSMMWDKPTYTLLLHSMSRLISIVGVQSLCCLPTDDAALLSYNSLVR